MRAVRDSKQHKVSQTKVIVDRRAGRLRPGATGESEPVVGAWPPPEGLNRAGLAWTLVRTDFKARYTER